MTTPARGSRVPAPASTPLPSDTSELEVSLSAVEQAIATLGHTLALPDVAAIEAASTALHDAMRSAMGQFAQVAKRGTMPMSLRTRFAVANGQIAAQREALFRATSMVEQNLEILIPRPMAETSVYSASGASQRGPGRVIAAS